MLERSQRLLLLTSVFIVAASGLVYELIAGAISSYLLGDAVTQFSLIIGLFLSAMGLGSYATQYIKKDLLLWFVRLELGIALVDRPVDRICASSARTNSLVEFE